MCCGFMTSRPFQHLKPAILYLVVVGGCFSKQRNAKKKIRTLFRPLATSQGKPMSTELITFQPWQRQSLGSWLRHVHLFHQLLSLCHGPIGWLSQHSISSDKYFYPALNLEMSLSPTLLPSPPLAVQCLLTEHKGALGWGDSSLIGVQQRSQPGVFQHVERNLVSQRQHERNWSRTR